MAEDANPTNPSIPSTLTTQTAPSEGVEQAEVGDAEVKAINSIVTALISLTEEQRLRALDYALRRFGAATVQTSPVMAPPIQAPTSAPPRHVIHPHTPSVGVVHDIRTLRESKAPKSAIEMAALVAYYVSELAPESDRKNEITKPDVERYFKAAGFNLPADASFTLVNAKNAGYLDSAGAGQYKLNPVGYNLVAHRMGTRDAEKKGSGRGRKTGVKRRPRQAKKALPGRK